MGICEETREVTKIYMKSTLNWGNELIVSKKEVVRPPIVHTYKRKGRKIITEGGEEVGDYGDF